MTFYDEVLSKPYDELRRIKCDMAHHKVLRSGKEMELPDELIPSKHYSQDEWCKEVETLYTTFSQALPPMHYRHGNFLVLPDDKFDFANATTDFHRCRLALELFILLHSLQGDLEWEDPSKFYIKIGGRCIVYRDWIK